VIANNDSFWGKPQQMQEEIYDALRESEARYRSLVENTPDIITRFDRQYRTVFVSSNVEAVTGIKAKAYIGKTHRELGFPEADCVFWETIAEQIFKSGVPFETEFEYNGPKGTILFNWRIVPERNEHGDIKCLLSIARDITRERKQEQEFTQLFNSIPAGFALHEIITDDDGAPCDYRFLQVNPAFENMTGLKSAAILGKTALDILPNIEQEWIENYGHVSLTGETLQFTQYSQELKSYYQVTAYCPQKGQFVTIFHDVTAQKATEAALRRNEMLLRIAGRVTRLGGWQVSLPDNKVYWSDTVAAIHEVPLEYQPDLEEALNFYAPEWQDRIRKVFFTCAKEGTPYDEEIELVTTRGRRVWVRTLGEAQRDASGAIIGVQGAFMDITERKRAEKITAETEARYHTLFMDFQDAIFINYDDKVAVVNQACVDLFGATSEEDLLGKSHVELFTPEYQEITQKRIEQLRNSKQPVPPIEKKIVRFDGATVDVEVTASPFPFRGATAIHVILRDITERKQKEAALQESERRFRLLFESLSDAVLIRSDNDKFILANPAASEMLGYSHEELLQMGPLDIVAPEYKALRPKLQAKLETGSVALFESMLVNHNGRKIPVEVNSRQILFEGGPSVISIIRDITDRKVAEEALRESEQRHRLLAENTLDPIWQMDMNLRFTYVNPASEIFGFTQEEYTGTYLHEHCTPEAMAYMAEILNEAISNKHGSAMFETEVLHRDGYPIPVEIHGRLLFDEAGEPVCIQGVTRDMRERKKALKEQQLLQEQLIQSQKMESIGLLAGGVAHDFNNMLGIIVGNIELAMSQVDEDSTIYADLQEARKAAKHSVGITRQLLTFARKEKTVPVALELNQSLENMLKILRHLIGETITLQWEPHANPDRVMMDPTQIDQMMTNLCVNARDALGERGAITIKTSNSFLDEHFCNKHTDLIPGDYVTVSVQDTGCGMSEDTIAHIFEPFFTTKEHGKGTGLGLATIYGIVKQSGGAIEVTSAPGTGTTFTIHLPAVSIESAVDHDSREYTLSDILKGHETILLVEDESGILRLCRAVLEKMGYTVLAADSPLVALRLAEEYPDDIHLIVTDVVMPEMNGPQLAQKIAIARPDIRCLYMSGYTADIIDQHKLKAQKIYCLEKPFSPHKLAVKVREVLSAPR
jgi:two-component system, cell cycle sensor histidine kinase and response regulator CckA